MPCLPFLLPSVSEKQTKQNNLVAEFIVTQWRKWTSSRFAKGFIIGLSPRLIFVPSYFAAVCYVCCFIICELGFFKRRSQPFYLWMHFMPVCSLSYYTLMPCAFWLYVTASIFARGSWATNAIRPENLCVLVCC